MGNIKKKEENILIKITKQEAFKMREDGYSEYVHMSRSKHPTYYLEEQNFLLKALKELKKNKPTK